MNDNLNICLLNDSFPPIIDGVANVMVNYADSINRSHGHACVVTPDHPNADDSAFGYPVIRYPGIDLSKQMGYVAGYPFSAQTIHRLSGMDIGLLHSHCPIMSTILARLLRDTLHAPVVFTYHTKFDIDIAHAVRGRLLQEGSIRLIAQNISACDEVWVVSRGAGENLRSLGYEGNYIIMPNGVDMPCGRASDDAISAAVSGYDLPEGVPVYLFIGRMMWYKGLRITLEGLRYLHDAGRDFRMVLIGDGTDRAAIEALARDLGIADKCIFTGAIHDRDVLKAWYCRADLFLFPSTFDTNGLVVREAAASSLASVLIRDSCAAEDIIDGQTGYLIDECSESMGAKLLELYDRTDDIRAVGDRASREIYISWEDAVARACDRYAVVMDNYRRGLLPKRVGPGEDFFRVSGELLDGAARLRERTIALREELQSAYEDIPPLRLKKWRRRQHIKRLILRRTRYGKKYKSHGSRQGIRRARHDSALDRAFRHTPKI